MAKILAIDDDTEILSLIKTALERENYAVQTVSDVQLVSEEDLVFADLILLDVMMPGEDGFTFCSRIRMRVDCPILFLTAKTEERDLIHGLGLGADDYIQKPFSIATLRARVAAHLRRENRQNQNMSFVRSGLFCLNLSTAGLSYNGIDIVLTKSEYKICAYLLENSGQVFTKEQIYEAVFGFDGESDESVIVEHIKNIRGKLKPYDADIIETVWGIGYRWRKRKL